MPETAQAQQTEPNSRQAVETDLDGSAGKISRQGSFNCWRTLPPGAAKFMLAALGCKAFTWHNGPIYINMKFDLTDGSSRAKTLACTVICFVGNTLTITGCIGLLLGAAGAFDMEIFALGLSSGVRIIGSVAIAGCLLSAIGYGLSDYAVNK